MKLNKKEISIIINLLNKELEVSFDDDVKEIITGLLARFNKSIVMKYK